MVKIIDKLRRAQEEGKSCWSFEYFPPKTPQGVNNLFERLERMFGLAPSFIDVTWGAGGSTADLTLEICEVAQTVYGLETCMHLTCTNMPRSKIDHALQQARDVGIQNILALRGDPPRGQENWTACEGGFEHAIDLVKYIRETHGDYFGIAVAGYPEGHIENPDLEADLMHLKAKIDAGADYIITQMFYDVDLFCDWVDRCREVGIDCPILPGIMPIQTYGGFQRMTSLSQTKVPPALLEALEPIKDDDQRVKDYGIQLAIDMCRRLQEHGIFAFHLYTMNLERSVRLILEGLDFVAPLETARPLPWNPSLSKKRAKENVRPIFWRNRARSYVVRTEAWDEFPNGRWGDSRSPAYGELDGWGMRLKYTTRDSLAMWGTPQSLADLYRVFVGFCRGSVKALPWSDTPLAPESRAIADSLAALNARGFLTINSQPPVNGVPSSHPVHGWGPRHGYIYQKAYIECFAPRELLDALVRRLATAAPEDGGDGVVTFHAVNRLGDLRTNHSAESPNAVTWGVFPGQEIMQPTVVDVGSFLAWKDEAFELWRLWCGLYSAEDERAGDDEQDRAVIRERAQARTLVNGVSTHFWLINLVHNDFHQPATALFDLLSAAAEDALGVPRDADADAALRAIAARGHLSSAPCEGKSPLLPPTVLSNKAPLPTRCQNGIAAINGSSRTAEASFS